MTSSPKPYKTRFAPSPTGFLHLGHGLSAMEVFKAAKQNNSTMVLRIEDIDQTRCKAEFTTAILDDLNWLGIPWDQLNPVRHQSDHFNDYKAALSRLEGLGLLYPCTCTRSQIKDNPDTTTGPEGIIYPGTCREKSLSAEHMDDTPFSIRLNLKKAAEYLKAQNIWPLHWVDDKAGKQLATPEIFGDVILARKDTPTSYHLAVVADDHIQEITHIVRGMDLFTATHIHRLLQALLGLETPTYYHHPLIMADDGEKLSKKNKVKPLKDLRNEGATINDFMEMINTI